MVLYRITLVPLAKELRAADSGLISPLYAGDAAFDGLERRSAQILKLLMEKGPDWVYFPDPDKSIFISDTPGQEEAAKREFEVEGIVLNYFSVIRYLGGYLGPQ